VKLVLKKKTNTCREILETKAAMFLEKTMAPKAAVHAHSMTTAAAVARRERMSKYWASQ